MRYRWILLCLVLMTSGCMKKESLTAAELAGILDVNWWKMTLSEETVSSIAEIDIGLFKQGVGYTNVCQFEVSGIDATGGLVALISLQRFRDTEDIVAEISVRNLRGSGSFLTKTIARPLGGLTPITTGSGMMVPMYDTKIPLICSGSFSFEKAESILFLEVKKKSNTK